MSQPLSPNNRSSIFGWVKNLKRGSLMSNESVNEISDTELLAGESKSPAKSIFSSSSQTQQQPVPLPQQSHGLFQSLSPHQEFLRPLLHHKSRLTNNVNRVRSNSFNQLEKLSSIRQHRDSFFQHNPLVDENSKYFGVPLDDAIDQACAKILILTNEANDQVLQYGKIPIVVAKCGVFLKTNGLEVEGIFRVGGSSKRLKELQVIFNSPPDFGKKLSWDGYTVHDAASILRRYLNALPEPLIPLELYEEFRNPLRKRPRIISYMKYKAEFPNKSIRDALLTPDTQVKELATAEATAEANSQPLTETNVDRHNSQKNLPQLADQPEASKKQKSRNYRKLTRDVHEAIYEYQAMVDDIPELSKQLLFYILDLLAMVQSHVAENLMSSRNLAAIFQPSILSHPNHDMDPVEYALSQLVVEFLIQYAYKLLPNQTPVLTSHNSSSSNATAPPEPQPENLAPTFRRRHSKSLSASDPHDDLIGYSPSQKPNIDFTSENEFELTDYDDSNNDSDKDDFDFTATPTDSQPPAPHAKAKVPEPVIIVSTPSSGSVPVVKSPQ